VKVSPEEAAMWTIDADDCDDLEDTLAEMLLITFD
jgi:hypothetical protein